MKKVVILILSSLTLCSCNNLDPYTNFINEIKTKHNSEYEGYRYHSFFKESVCVNEATNEIYIIVTKVDVDYGRNFSVGTYYLDRNVPILLDEYITISYINNQVLEYKQNIRRVVNQNENLCKIYNTKINYLDETLSKEEVYDLDLNKGKQYFNVDCWTFFLDSPGNIYTGLIDKVDINYIEDNIIYLDVDFSYKTIHYQYYYDKKLVVDFKYGLISKEMMHFYFDDDLKIYQIDKVDNSTYYIFDKDTNKISATYLVSSKIKLVSRSEFEVTL